MGNLPSITTESGLRFQRFSKAELDRIDRRVGGELTLTDVHRHCQLPEGNPFLSRMFEMYSDGHGYITTHQIQSLLAKLSSLGPDKIGQLQFAFCILDQDNDGYVTQEDILHYLLLTVADKRAGLSQGQLEQIVKATVLHHDVDGDGRLNQLEFESLFSQYT